VQYSFALDQPIEPISSIYLLLKMVKNTQTVSFALVEMSLKVNMLLIETNTSALFEIVHHLPSEFDLLKGVLANELNDLSSRSDVN